MVEDEEEPVDDDAGDGDVEPERQSPAGDDFVAAEAAAQSESESDEHERDDGHGEDGVGDENGEVRWANGALAGKADESGVSVEVKIRDEKTGGAGDGREHAGFMREDFAAADE